MERLGQRVDEPPVRPGLGDVDEGVGLAPLLGHRDVLAADGLLLGRIEEDLLPGDDGREVFEDARFADALGADQQRVAADLGPLGEFGQDLAVAEADRVGEDGAVGCAGHALRAEPGRARPEADGGALRQRRARDGAGAWGGGGRHHWQSLAQSCPTSWITTSSTWALAEWKVRSLVQTSP